MNVSRKKMIIHDGNLKEIPFTCENFCLANGWFLYAYEGDKNQLLCCDCEHGSSAVVEGWDKFFEKNKNDIGSISSDDSSLKVNKLGTAIICTCGNEREKKIIVGKKQGKGFAFELIDIKKEFKDISIWSGMSFAPNGADIIRGRSCFSDQDYMIRFACYYNINTKQWIKYRDFYSVLSRRPLVFLAGFLISEAQDVYFFENSKTGEQWTEKKDPGVYFFCHPTAQFIVRDQGQEGFSILPFITPDIQAALEHINNITLKEAAHLHSILDGEGNIKIDRDESEKDEKLKKCSLVIREVLKDNPISWCNKKRRV